MMIITKTAIAPPTTPPAIAAIGWAFSASVNEIQPFIMTFKINFTCHVLPVGVGIVGLDVGLEIGVVTIIKK